jgi:DNA-binding response OmpR family regulator
LGVLRALRQQRNNIPVLVLTARDSREDKILGLDSGADDYLTKPLDIDLLEAIVKQWLEYSFKQI